MVDKAAGDGSKAASKGFGDLRALADAALSSRRAPREWSFDPDSRKARSMLAEAVSCKDLAALDELLDAGVSVEAPNGMSPLANCISSVPVE